MAEVKTTEINENQLQELEAELENMRNEIQMLRQNEMVMRDALVRLAIILSKNV